MKIQINLRPQDVSLLTGGENSSNLLVDIDLETKLDDDQTLLEEIRKYFAISDTQFMHGLPIVRKPGLVKIGDFNGVHHNQGS